MAVSKSTTKLWKATKDSSAGIMISPDAVIVAGSSRNFFGSDKNGNYVSGPFSMVTTSEQIRQGGLFVQMPDFAKMIPSTIVTVQPGQLPFPPVALFAGIALAMPFILAMVK